MVYQPHLRHLHPLLPEDDESVQNYFASTQPFGPQLATIPRVWQIFRPAFSGIHCRANPLLRGVRYRCPSQLPNMVFSVKETWPKGVDAMKLRIMCNECAKQKPTFQYVDIVDDGRYHTTCPLGHTQTIILENEKFQILFDLGISALMDRYPGEAVGRVAAALERFYEYSIIVMSDHSGTSADILQKTWKYVQQQSERQLGAYYFIFLNHLQQAPPEFPQKMVLFRNKVIHQGYIPSHSEAQEYINEVYKYIGQVWKTLQSHCGAFGNHSAKVFPKHAGVPKMNIAIVAITFSVPNDSGWVMPLEEVMQVFGTSFHR